MKLSRELLKGNTATMILKVVSEKDTYGYEMAKTIAERSGDLFKLNEGTLYPILHTLVKEKLLESYEKESPVGKKRKYYRITAAGRIELATRIEEWRRFSSSVNVVLEDS